MKDTASLNLWTEGDGSVHYTVRLGAGGGSAHCSQYSDRTPIAGLWRAGVSVTISPADDTHVTDAELAFARDFADMAAAYRDECERFHTPDTGPVDAGADEKTRAGRVA